MKLCHLEENRPGDHHVTQNKPVLGIQIPHFPFHVRNLGSKKGDMTSEGGLLRGRGSVRRTMTRENNGGECDQSTLCTCMKMWENETQHFVQLIWTHINDLCILMFQRKYWLHWHRKASSRLGWSRKGPQSESKKHTQYFHKRSVRENEACKRTIKMTCPHSWNSQEGREPGGSQETGTRNHFKSSR
jgi:hypothetical protein